ncbi:MAG: hypothetical protein B7Z19_07170 [Polynucleobacter sp. 32-46-5]|nr:MAG: hypothetical protein B7Z19_07170 [Polynucleobacter sp. 32-46-5]
MTALAPSLSFFLLLASQHSIANQDLSPYNLKVSVESVGSKFIIDASYMASVSQCEAYMFLTDYEDIKLSPGMIESKVRKRDGNKVVVERLVEESVLLFPLKMHSVLEYTELPNRGLTVLCFVNHFR